jgi:hypothetical protein
MVNDPGEISVLPRGTEVVVNYEINGRPVIFGVLKSAVTHAVEVNPARLSEIRGVGGEDGVYSQEGPARSSSRPPNDPVDVISDDWIRKGKHNNYTGVLAGGTNVMHSSPMAQIRTHGVTDMVEVFANLYRHISSLGNIEIMNDGGKTSLTWRGGADQLTENGAHAENWTLRLDAGAAGDLFRLSVTTPNNNTLCEVHMSADGRLSLTGVAGIDMSSGANGTAREDVGEDKEVSVLGGMTTTVGAEVLETYGASRVTAVGQSSTLTTGNDLIEGVSHDRMTHIGGKLATTVDGGGPVPPPESGNVAILWDAVNGGVETVTGNPLSGGVPSAKQSQNFVNYAGDFNYAVPVMGKFNLVSMMPNSVLLAANGAAVPTPDGHKFSASASHHVCMWEEMEKMVREIMIWADTHTHLTAVGPTSPAAAAATGPMTLKVLPTILPVMSMRVLVGG